MISIARRIAGALALAFVCSYASGQAYPSRTVRIISPFPPGGTSDILARTLAEKLALEWGQPVIAENRPGAAGNIASEYVAKQRGDPHVLPSIRSARTPSTRRSIRICHSIRSRTSRSSPTW